jgi:hypothetical protein
MALLPEVPMRTRLLLLLPLLALGACDVLSTSDEIDFLMQIREVEPFETAPPIEMRTEAGRIVVTGGSVTECVQNAPTGNVVLISRTQIEVRLTEQQGEAACTPGRRYFEYDVFIGPLHPRRYQVNVTYRELDGTQRNLATQHIDVG